MSFVSVGLHTSSVSTFPRTHPLFLSTPPPPQKNAGTLWTTLRA
jgi:hypothetical protein